MSRKDILEVLEDVGGSVDVEELRYQLALRGKRLTTGQIDRLLRDRMIEPAHSYRLTPKGRRMTKPSAESRYSPVGGI